MMRLSGSPPGRWRGSGDDRWVWIENFRRRHWYCWHWHRAKWSTDLDNRTRTRHAEVRSPAMSGPGVPTRPGVGLDPSLYPFENTLNGQHEDHALSHFSNILEFITCHLIRHKSAGMPPKVPSPLSLVRTTVVVTLFSLTRLWTRTRSSLMPKEETGPGRR